MKHTIKDWEKKREWHSSEGRNFLRLQAAKERYPNEPVLGRHYLEEAERHAKYAAMCQEVIDMLKNKEKLTKFLSNFEQEDMPPEFAKVIDENFKELL